MAYTPIFSAPGGLGGTQHVYRFPNGWGASVVSRGSSSELAVTRPVDEHPDHFYLVEDDPLTADNAGTYLSEEQVTGLLDEIAARPYAGRPDLTERWQSTRDDPS